MSCHSELRVTSVTSVTLTIGVTRRFINPSTRYYRDFGNIHKNFDDVCIRAYKLKRNRRRNQVPDITGILPIITKTFFIKNQVPDITGIIKLSKLKDFLVQPSARYYWDYKIGSAKCLILPGF